MKAVNSFPIDRQELKHFTTWQNDLVNQGFNYKMFLEGHAGTGKTTASTARVLRMLSEGVRGDSILLLSPQRSLADPYLEALNDSGAAAGGVPSVSTLGGIARRMVDIFWPVLAEEAGFQKPQNEPVFLTMETAQYYMARVVGPLLDQGLFQGLRIPPNRIYSQILDNLNKSAAVGFPIEEISAKLTSAWTGDLSQKRLYDEVQESALQFRRFCYKHNLLDFSLQLDLFLKFLWPKSLCRRYLKRTYRHLVYDNVEEDVPAAHDLIGEWLSDFDSFLLIYDQEAGYRSFLGADPQSGRELMKLCPVKLEVDTPFTSGPEIELVSKALVRALYHNLANTPAPFVRPDIKSRMVAPSESSPISLFSNHRYFPEMIDSVCEHIIYLVSSKQTSPGEVVVLAPFLTDSLRFALSDRLERGGVAVRSHRPSRALREEPAVLCLLTLASLAHPDWSGMWQGAARASRYDVAYALLQAIEGLDLVRAQLLANTAFTDKDGAPRLLNFDRVPLEVQRRITFTFGERYQKMRSWIESYKEGNPQELDHFLSRLFGEVLSQPGFGFHSSFTAGEAAANLVESARKFRWSTVTPPEESVLPIGLEYVRMVKEGVVASQYLLSWRLQPEEAVLLAPAYTFLVSTGRWTTSSGSILAAGAGRKDWNSRLPIPMF
jgi:superfamily I DNA/RNA helicase